MPKAFSILFGALFTLATAYSLGCIFLQRLPHRLTREEQPLFCLLTGAPLLSLLVFALACCHLLYDAAFLAVGAASIGLALKLKAFALPTERLAPLSRLWRWAFFVPYAVFAVVVFLYAMAPEWSPDGSGYHLGIVAHYYRAHAFVKIAGNMYSFLSQGLEMLFLFAWAFGRHSAAALVHCAFLLTLPLLLLRFGQRHGIAAAGAAAALFVFLSPVAMVDGASAYNDVAVACVLFAVFYLCEIDAPPLATGLLAGFCYALKYTAFLGVVYVLLRYSLRRRWRDLGVVCLPIAVVILPWVLRNLIWTGNPFSPLLNSWFPNPYVHVSFEQDYQQTMRWYSGLEGLSQLPLELTVRGRILGGMLGPLFLLAPLALLSLRTALGRRALFCAALFAAPYAANMGTRFLIPALPFVSLALAAALPSFTLPALVLVHAVLAFPDVPKLYADPYAWRIPSIPFRQALRFQSEQSWLSYKWPPYRVAKMVDQSTPEDAIVFSFSAIAESYTSREIRVSFQSAPNELLRDALLTALLPDFQPDQRIEFHFPRQSMSALRVVQTAGPRPGGEARDVWSMAELRLLDGSRELLREPDWLLTARPNPWEVGLAFDNCPLTRWRAWQWLGAGMYVQVDFGHPRTLDTVRIEASSDQYAVRLRLEGRDPAGQWRQLVPAPVTTGIAPPLELRRAAIEELERAGISYLLVSDDDFKAADFHDNADLWGIRQAGAVDNVRLYKLE